MSLDPVLETIDQDARSAAEADHLGVLRRLLSALRAGKIEAIKQVRKEAGMTLKDAKEYVEDLASAVGSGWAINPHENKENYMVLRQCSDGDEWSIVVEDCSLLGAKSEANYATDHVPETKRVLLVKVVGRSKLVFKMEDE